MMHLAQRSVRALERAYGPEGYNLGANLGAVAGAGVEDHVHLHVVPRWKGDTNFMPVLGDVRVLPQRLEDSWRGPAGRIRGAGKGRQLTDIDPGIFKAYDVRGLYPSQIDEHVAYAVGVRSRWCSPTCARRTGTRHVPCTWRSATTCGSTPRRSRNASGAA